MTKGLVLRHLKRGTIPWYKAIATDCIARAHRGEMPANEAKAITEACRIASELALVLKQFQHLGLHELTPEETYVLDGRGAAYRQKRVTAKTGIDSGGNKIDLREVAVIGSARDEQPNDSLEAEADYEMIY